MPNIIIKVYIAGNNQRTRNTISLIEEACKRAGSEKGLKIEAIDIMKNAQLAEDKKILAIPTICREKPVPERRVIGELKDIDKAMRAVDFLLSDLQK